MFLCEEHDDSGHWGFYPRSFGKCEACDDNVAKACADVPSSAWKRAQPEPTGPTVEQARAGRGLTTEQLTAMNMPETDSDGDMLKEAMAHAQDPPASLIPGKVVGLHSGRYTFGSIE